MAIYTPRGLKIRFSTPYSFSLMARLFPEITPFRVLKKTEAIENIPDALAAIGALVIAFFFPNMSCVKIFGAITAIYLVGSFMKLTGLFFIPLIIPISEAFSYIQGYGIITIALGVIGYFKIGLTKTIVLILVLLATNIVDYLLEFIRALLCKAMNKPYLGMSELDFINAYKMLAAKTGNSADINVSQIEIDSEAWQEPYMWLEYNWPEVTCRYTAY